MKVGKQNGCLKGLSFMELNKITELILVLPFITQGRISDVKIL